MIKAICLENLESVNGIILDSLDLIPIPKELTLNSEPVHFKIKEFCYISSINVSNLDSLIEDFKKFITDFASKALQIEIKEDSEVKLSLLMKDEEFLNDSDGSYNLKIDQNRIIISSLSDKGIFYGLQTLNQVIKNFIVNQKGSKGVPLPELILPHLVVRDAPDLNIRGIVQDISRGQIFTIENAKRYIDILCHYKLNFYGLYIEDVFAHPQFPEIGKDRGALTPKEIEILVKYAEKKHISLFPVFECLGHVDNILQHKRFRNLGEFPGAQCFAVSKPEVFQFLKDYISELAKHFPAEYFHIGCDESFDLGKFSSKDYVTKKGYGQALVEYYEKVYNIVKRAGKNRVIMYDDIVRKNEYITNNLNKDIILLYWDYMPKKEYPEVKKLLDKGFKVIVSPSMLNWQRHFPDNKNASRNIISIIKSAFKYKKQGCLGVLTSTWGDMRYYSLRENEIFGAVLTGATSWNVRDNKYKNVVGKYGKLFYGLSIEQIDDFVSLFTKLSKMPSTYYRVSPLVPPLFYTYLFKHPFPSEDYQPSFEKYEKLLVLASDCQQLYENLNSVVNFEKKNFEYIGFGIDLARLLSEKLILSSNIPKLLKENNDLETIERIIKDIDKIKTSFIKIRNNYERLWTRAAKRPCVDQILKQFDFIIDCYNKKRNELKRGIIFVDPYLPSEWIWSRKRGKIAGPVYFRKKIKLMNPFEKVVIQCIASNYMKVYINDRQSGEVLSRYSMSILPIVFRVKTFDITEHLKLGENIVAIEAYNYDITGSGINIYGVIKQKDNLIVELSTDKSWLVKEGKIGDSYPWKSDNYDDGNWKMAYSYGRPPVLNGDIFKPDLLKGEVSNTQDYFGIEAYFSQDFLSELPVKSSNIVVDILRPYD